MPSGGPRWSHVIYRCSVTSVPRCSILSSTGLQPRALGLAAALGVPAKEGSDVSDGSDGASVRDGTFVGEEDGRPGLNKPSEKRLEPPPPPPPTPPLPRRRALRRLPRCWSPASAASSMAPSPDQLGLEASAAHPMPGPTSEQLVSREAREQLASRDAHDERRDASASPLLSTAEPSGTDAARETEDGAPELRLPSERLHEVRCAPPTPQPALGLIASPTLLPFESSPGRHPAPLLPPLPQPPRAPAGGSSAKN